MWVRGVLRLPSDAAVPGCRALISIEDVRYQDTASVTLAQTVVDVEPGATMIRFSLRLLTTPDLNRRRLHLRAHVDVDGDSLVSPGDYVTARRHVVEEGAAHDMTATLERVG